jgi:hypothetical protein
MIDLIFGVLAAVSLSAAVLRSVYAARAISNDALATRKWQTGPLR